jgi:hypothetical protein
VNNLPPELFTLKPRRRPGASDEQWEQHQAMFRNLWTHVMGDQVAEKNEKAGRERWVIVETNNKRTIVDTDAP